MTLGRQITLTLATRPHRWQQLTDLAMPNAETSHFHKANIRFDRSLSEKPIFGWKSLKAPTDSDVSPAWGSPGDPAG